jgi:GNAT superfamily N-acetyltransferase
MEIRPLDLTDDGETTRWYAAMRAGALAGRETAPIDDEPMLLTSLRTNDSNAEKDRRAYGAWAGPDCVGTLIVALERADNAHIAEVDVTVPPDHRRHGIGTALLAHATRIAADSGRRTLAAEVTVPAGAGLDGSPGGRFAIAHGFTSGLSEQCWTLALPVDPATLDELDTPIPGYRLTGWLDLPPAEHLSAFAALHTAMDRDVPMGELDRKPAVFTPERLLAMQKRHLDQGYRLITTMMLDDTGDAAGYTTILVKPGRSYALQDDTLVLDRHRGHRLGTVAKVANLRVLARYHPGTRYIHTWVADGNDPMHGINTRLGYRATETMHEVERKLDDR